MKIIRKDRRPVIPAGTGGARPADKPLRAAELPERLHLEERHRLHARGRRERE